MSEEGIVFLWIRGEEFELEVWPRRKGAKKATGNGAAPRAFTALRGLSLLDTLKGRLLKFAVFFYTEFESVYTQRSSFD